MPICHKRKLAFCHVPRTGGSSIVTALKMHIPDKHFPASWYRNHYPDYHLFATFRPYRDRIQSALGYRIPQGTIYDDFTGSYGDLVDKIVYAEKNGLIMKPNDYFLDCNVDTLLLYNNLEGDLNTMLHQLGHRLVQLPHLNSFR